MDLYIVKGQQVLTGLGISSNDPVIKRATERFRGFDPRTIDGYAAKFGLGRRTGAEDER